MSYDYKPKPKAPKRGEPLENLQCTHTESAWGNEAACAVLDVPKKKRGGDDLTEEIAALRAGVLTAAAEATVAVEGLRQRMSGDALLRLDALTADLEEIGGLYEPVSAAFASAIGGVGALTDESKTRFASMVQAALDAAAASKQGELARNPDATLTDPASAVDASARKLEGDAGAKISNWSSRISSDRDADRAAFDQKVAALRATLEAGNLRLPDAVDSACDAALDGIEARERSALEVLDAACGGGDDARASVREACAAFVDETSALPGRVESELSGEIDNALLDSEGAARSLQEATELAPVLVAERLLEAVSGLRAALSTAWARAQTALTDVGNRALYGQSAAIGIPEVDALTLEAAVRDGERTAWLAELKTADPTRFDKLAKLAETLHVQLTRSDTDERAICDALRAAKTDEDLGIVSDLVERAGQGQGTLDDRMTDKMSGADLLEARAWLHAPRDVASMVAMFNGVSTDALGNDDEKRIFEIAEDEDARGLDDPARRTKLDEDTRAFLGEHGDVESDETRASDGYRMTSAKHSPMPATWMRGVVHDALNENHQGVVSDLLSGNKESAAERRLPEVLAPNLTQGVRALMMGQGGKGLPASDLDEATRLLAAFPEGHRAHAQSGDPLYERMLELPQAESLQTVGAYGKAPAMQDGGKLLAASEDGSDEAAAKLTALYEGKTPEERAAFEDVAVDHLPLDVDYPNGTNSDVRLRRYIADAVGEDELAPRWAKGSPTPNLDLIESVRQTGVVDAGKAACAAGAGVGTNEALMAIAGEHVQTPEDAARAQESYAACVPVGRPVNLVEGVLDEMGDVRGAKIANQVEGPAQTGDDSLRKAERVADTEAGGFALVVDALLGRENALVENAQDVQRLEGADGKLAHPTLAPLAMLEEGDVGRAASAEEASENDSAAYARMLVEIAVSVGLPALVPGIAATGESAKGFLGVLLKGRDALVVETLGAVAGLSTEAAVGGHLTEENAGGTGVSMLGALAGKAADVGLKGKIPAWKKFADRSESLGPLQRAARAPLNDAADTLVQAGVAEIAGENPGTSVATEGLESFGSGFPTPKIK